MYKKMLVSFVVIACLACFSATSSAQWVYWNNTDGDNDWNNPDNWSTGAVPNNIDDQARIQIPLGPVVGAGSTVDAFRIFVGMTATNHGTLTIDGGTVTTTGYITSAYHVGNTAEITMNDGYVRVGAIGGSNGHFYHGREGRATFYMKGGVMDIVNNLYIGRQATSTGLVYLEGGTITANNLIMRETEGAIGFLEITGGTLIINGDRSDNISTWIANGWITGYGDEDNVFFDYGVTNPGKTTVWAVPEPTTIALLGAGLLGLVRRKR